MSAAVQENFKRKLQDLYCKLRTNASSWQTRARAFLRDYLDQVELHLLVVRAGVFCVCFYAVHLRLETVGFVCFLVALLVNRQLSVHSRRRSLQRLYRLACRRPKAPPTHGRTAELMRSLCLSGDLDRTDWLNEVLQQFWPLGLCFAFQDLLNHRYIGLRWPQSEREQLFGLKFEFFQLNADFAPAVGEIEIVHEQCRTDELPLRCALSIVGTAMLSDYREHQISASAGSTAAAATGSSAEKTPSAAQHQPKKPSVNSQPIVGKNVHLKNVRFRLRAKLVLRPLVSFAPFFTGIELTAPERPSLLDAQLRLELRSLLRSERKVDDFLEYLAEQICSPFVGPRRPHLQFNQNAYLASVHIGLLHQQQKQLPVDRRRQLRQLLDRPWQQLRQPATPLTAREQELLVWYEQQVISKWKTHQIELVQRLQSPLPTFVCFVKLIEFQDLPGASTSVVTSQMKEQVNQDPQLFCHIKLGTNQLQTQPVPLKCNPLFNETLWSAVHDFGEQFELTLYRYTGQLHSPGELVTPMSYDYEPIIRRAPNSTLQELGSVSFRVHKENFQLTNASRPTDGRTCTLDVKDIAKSGQFDCSVDERRTANGRDVWLPLSRACSGLVHLQFALFSLTGNPQALLESNQLNTALSANLLSRHRKLPVALLWVHLDRLLVTNPRERAAKPRQDEALYSIEVGFRRRRQQTHRMPMQRGRVQWKRTFDWLLDEPPFDQELQFRLRDWPLQTGLAEAKTHRAQRFVLGTLHLGRLKFDAGKQQLSSGATVRSAGGYTLSERLPLYAGNSEPTMLDQLRSLQLRQLDRLLSPSTSGRPAGKNDAGCLGDFAPGAVADEPALRDCELFGLLHVTVAVRFVRLQPEVVQNLQSSYVVKAAQEQPVHHGRCSCLRCCDVSIASVRPADDLKDTELMKLIKQRIDENQIVPDSSLCQVMLRCRLLRAGQTLEVSVERAVNVPQVDILQQMQVRAGLELWKGNTLVASVQSPFVGKSVTPVFEFGTLFELTGGNPAQYALRASLVHRSGFFRRRRQLLAEGFCSLPLLDLNESVVYRWYPLANVSTAMLNLELNDEQRNTLGSANSE